VKFLFVNRSFIYPIKKIPKKIGDRNISDFVTNSKLLTTPRCKFRFRSSLGLAVLLIAGYTGNYFNLPLFFGVDFLFGSIAVLMVVYLYGMGWGAIAAAIAGIHTMFLWGHPYAAIILTVEGFFVGWGLRRKSPNLLLLDGFYWIFIGMPLVWLFYAEVMSVPAQSVLLVMLKQSVNGIFNALIASLLLTHSPVQNWVARPKVTKTLSLQQSLFNLLVAFVLIPALTLLVLHSRSAITNIEQTIQAKLETVSTLISTEVNLWHEQNLNVLKQLAQVTARSPMNSLKELQESAELLHRAFPTFEQLFVVNREGETLASYPRADNTNVDSTNLRAVDLTNPSITSEISLEGNDLHSPMLIQTFPVTRNNRFLGNVVSEIKLSIIEQRLKSFSTPEKIDITLIDRQNQVITSTRSDLSTLSVFDQRQGGEIRRLNTKIYQWLPLKKMPIMRRWEQSYYVQTTPIANHLPLAVIVAVSSKPYISYLQKLYIKSLTIMLLIMALALILANSISRWLAQPILQLAKVTTNLPDKLLDQKTIAWPRSWVTEMNALVSNFQCMAATLEQKFQEIQTAKQELEQRVQERTQELLTANRDLEAEVTERKRVAEELQLSESLFRAQAKKLEKALHELQHAQAQLVQTEKMSSLGQLVAGIAHEINNPVNFIYGNLIHAKGYTQDLLGLVDVYQQNYPHPTPAIEDEIKAIDLEFLRNDIPQLIESMQVGAERIHEIVQSLRTFSRLDEAEVKEVDIYQGIESTLMLLKSRLKATAKHPSIEIIKEYAHLSLVECYPGQLNQVFMNILVNAIDSLEAKFSSTQEENSSSLTDLPWIRIRTQVIEKDWVAIHIADNGLGMTKEQSTKLFDPFFTTKPVGKGTGLGLSISYRIIVDKHGGKLYCLSAPNQGAEFIIEIPLQQK
jgi:two-component system, NtrC family, sensor kinase